MRSDPLPEALGMRISREFWGGANVGCMAFPVGAQRAVGSGERVHSHHAVLTRLKNMSAYSFLSLCVPTRGRELVIP